MPNETKPFSKEEIKKFETPDGWEEVVMTNQPVGNMRNRVKITIDALIADKERLVGALEGIKNYPPKGADRRTKDGYPEEIIYDEFAYKRIIDSYREGARKALRTVGEGE